MRLIFALIYMALGMWIYFLLGGGNLPSYIGMAVWFALLFSSVIVCNEGFLRKIKGQTDQQYIDELVREKKAIEETYQAREAITLDDLSTSCLCHIIDIGKGESLCLYGQYLYEYTEINDDPDVNQKRSFPTSSFSLVRKIKNDEILQLNIGNVLIDDNYQEDVSLKILHALGIKLEDGEIIKGVSFEEIKKALRGV